MSYKWPEARAELRSGFNSVLAAYGRAGRFEEAAAVYKGKMMGKVLRPDEITYTSLLNAAYRSRSQPLEVVQWLREEAAGVEPTVEMLTAMLNCYRSVTGIRCCSRSVSEAPGAALLWLPARRSASEPSPEIGTSHICRRQEAAFAACLFLSLGYPVLPLHAVPHPLPANPPLRLLMGSCLVSNLLTVSTKQ